MTVTIQQDDLPENGTLDDFLNIVNRQSVIPDCVRTHIVDGIYHDEVFWVLLQDPYPRLDGARENIEMFVTKRADGTLFVCHSNEEK